MTMPRPASRFLGGLCLSLLLASCASSSDGSDLCGLGSGSLEACMTQLGGLLPHPCEAQAAATCEGSADTSCEPNALAECATNYYLRGYQPESLPPCDPSKPNVVIGQTLELSLFRGFGISDEAVVEHSQGLQRYYELYQLTMETRDVAAPDPIENALSGTLAEFNQALSDAGIPPTATSLTPEQEALAESVIGKVMFAPTREFLQRHAVPAEAKVNVAAIDQILSPDVVDLMELDGTVVGLGLSPAVIARTSEQDDSTQSLNTMLELDEDFTPTLFVGHNDIARLTGNFDVVVAHEMGHALGLVHVDDPGNLMEPYVTDNCRTWLSQEQVDMMGPFSDVTPTPDDALSRILQGRKNLLRRILESR